MLRHFPKVPSLIVATIKEWRKNNPNLLAAAMAYYSFFSLIPFLVIVAAIGNVFLGETRVSEQLDIMLTTLFGSNVGDVIEASLVKAYRQPTPATIAAVILLIFGASYMFVQMRNALNVIWGVKSKKNLLVEFVEGRLVSLIMIIVMAALTLLWFMISVSVSTTIHLSSSLNTSSGLLLETINFTLLFGMTAIIFGMIYKLLPSVRLKWNDVILGAVVTSFLFTAGSHIFVYYLSKVGVASLYGVAGSMVVLLIWLYLSAQLFLFGVMFTKVYALSHGSRKKSKAK